MPRPRYVVGIDEAGRGPLAGPVAVGVVVVDLEQISNLGEYFSGVRDSKKLSGKNREIWFQKLKTERDSGRLFFAVTLVGNKIIDRNGIVSAISHGLDKGLEELNVNPETCRILLDGGLRAPDRYQNQQTIIRGDESEPVIALASIVAKVIRDRWLIGLAKKYPDYGLEKHKGYGTKYHYLALERFGLSPIHRETFCRRIFTKKSPR
ncbi:ribonuclease HII [Candidatus Nomurabacteria bacterium]|nr:ribonuclease HII [Candidatus Nomurabacteria bacterium]